MADGASAIVKRRFTFLIVEDHTELLASLIVFAKTFPDTEVWAAKSFLTAAAILRATRVDLLLCEAALPGEMTGIDVAELAVATFPEVAVVMFSDDPEGEIEGLIKRYTFLQKPFGREELTNHIDAAILKKLTGG